MSFILLELMDAVVKVPSAGNLELLGVTLNPPFHCYACRTITWKQYRLRCEIFRRFCQLSKKTWNFIIKVAVQQRLSFSAKTGDVRWDCMCTDNSNTEFYYLCVDSAWCVFCFCCFMFLMGATEKFWSLELHNFVVALDFGSCKSSPVKKIHVVCSTFLHVELLMWLPLTFPRSVYAFTHYAHHQWIRIARLVRVTVLKSTWPH